jgi:hypothetical protein
MPTILRFMEYVLVSVLQIGNHDRQISVCKQDEKDIRLTKYKYHTHQEIDVQLSCRNISDGVGNVCCQRKPRGSM